MNTRPTTEQVAEARLGAQALLTIGGQTIGPYYQNVIRVLLAATEPPTDAELAEEAARFAPTYFSEPWQATLEERAALERAYIAGARQEGRRA